MEPLLSVITITYNHKPYIAKCIEGVLMQKVNFPIEFIIAEDCSTDGTQTVCKQYAQQFPELIKLITSDSNVGAAQNERRAIEAAKGKYIAFCEGDDYWTNPNKLQIQVDFLEQHQDFRVCFHDRMIEKDGEITHNKEFLPFCDSNAEGFELTTSLFFSHWLTFPFSMVFKRDSFNINWYDQYQYFRDSHMIFHLLQNGKGFIFNFVGGVRTVHNNSMFYSMDRMEAARIDMLSLEELYIHNKKTKDIVILKQEYGKRIKYYINLSLNNHSVRCYHLILSWRLFLLKHSIKELAKNLSALSFSIIKYGF